HPGRSQPAWRHRRAQGRSGQHPEPRRAGRQVPPPGGVLRRTQRGRGGRLERPGLAVARGEPVKRAEAGGLSPFTSTVDTVGVNDGEASSTRTAQALLGLERTRGKGFAVFHPTPNLQEPDMNDTTAKPRPLDGITVVSLEHAIAAPFCTRQLADLGARVIKVERPGSGDFARGYDERVDGLASHFVWTNRSKESLTLDVKQQEAAQVLDQ